MAGAAHIYWPETPEEVPGARTPALVIGPVDHKYLASKSILSATLTNTGNVRLKPSGELVASEKDGREISRVALTMDSVYAGDTTSIEVPFEKALLPGDYRITLTLNYEGGTASAVGVPLNVPKATLAEAAGAPTGASTFATVNQQQPAAQARIDLRLVAAVGGTALVLIGALIILRHRRRRSAVPGPTRPGFTPRGGPAPVSMAGLPHFEASRAAIRSASAPPPTPLRYPLARAAGEREDAPLRPSSWAHGPASGSAPVQPQYFDASNVGRLGRLAGQKPASTPPPPDSDA